MVLLVQYLMAFYLTFVKFSDCFPDNLFLLATCFVCSYGNETEEGLFYVSIESPNCLELIINCLVAATEYDFNKLKSSVFFNKLENSCWEKLHTMKLK